MRTMRRLAIVGGTIALTVTAATLVSAAGGRVVTSPTTIHVIEHATTDTVTDTGRRGDSPGDLLTWHNKIYNRGNTKQVGRDQGDCIRISPANGSWECRWITWVPGGAITVEGPFYDSRNDVLPITGGKGMFRNARGSMTLKARHGGTEYAFIFNVIP